MVDQTPQALQVAEFLQRPALLVVFKQVAISHGGAPRLYRKGNDLFVNYSESQQNGKCQDLKAMFGKKMLGFGGEII